MTEKPKLVVIGSANRDLVVRTERIPAAGETALGEKFVTAPGGKGGNQAVAAARLGADVWFVGRVGADSFGEALAAELAGAGIHTNFLRVDDHEPTGVALIGVDYQGQNAIIVAPGANNRVSRADVDGAHDEIARAFAVVIQMEIPSDTVAYAVDVAKRAGTRVILNPAPCRSANPLSDALIQKIDVLTPNEHEAAQLLGYDTPEGLNWETVAARLLAKGTGSVIITLGEQGCLLADCEGIRPIPAIPVKALDTTAAGDCFTGALALGLAEKMSLDDAAAFASRAAAISVTRMGAQPSLPTRQEVERFYGSPLDCAETSVG